MLTTDTVADRIAATLACAAFDHRVGGTLFLNLRPGLLAGLAAWLAAALGDGDGTPRIVTLSAGDSDDNLWWQVSPQGNPGAGFAPAPGELQESPGSALIALIPDLARANLAVTRAATVLAGAEWAVADRHGLHAGWQPRGRWLAACRSRDVERLSPHLLDRFPVRVDATGFGMPGRPEDLLAALDRDVPDGLPAGMPTPYRPSGAPPAMTTRAAEAVTGLVGDVTAPHRRDLALARVARAVAAAEAAVTTEPPHVRRAAEILGIRRPEPAPADERGSPSAAPGEPQPAGTAPLTLPVTTGDDPAAQPTVVTDEDVVVGDAAVRPRSTSVLPAASGPERNPARWPYPEDRPSAMPDFASLRPLQPRGLGRRSLRGPIIGSMASRRPVDIAHLATVLRAATFRLVRHGPGGRLRIHPSDLRSHRRQPQTDAVLVLLIDHTSRRAWDVTGALTPYLGWAYTRRAAVSLIEIGHRNATSELRAERHRPAGVLDPLLGAALSREPGRATPLAHGLDLAVQEIRLRLRNLPIRNGEAWFVVVSDGRGNVPLEDSQRNITPTSVSREGIDDALAAAAGVAGLRPVRAVVLAPPELSHHRDLPFALADAMAGIVAGPEDEP
ncbi:hypothetical protein [Actinoplanes sp. CA-252034]|uniref:hypothetical protein n=1 Tax=Actinoplanes sp. CA-252034 TaxID=3239906 RepID=UPI003D9820E1